MPRIDYSYLIEPLRSIGISKTDIILVFHVIRIDLDSAHESFRAFIRLEMLIILPLLLG